MDSPIITPAPFSGDVTLVDQPITSYGSIRLRCIQRHTCGQCIREARVDRGRGILGGGSIGFCCPETTNLIRQSLPPFALIGLCLVLIYTRAGHETCPSCCTVSSRAWVVLSPHEHGLYCLLAEHGLYCLLTGHGLY